MSNAHHKKRKSWEEACGTLLSKKNGLVKAAENLIHFILLFFKKLIGLISAKNVYRLISD